MNKKFIMAVFCIIAIGGCATTPRLMVPQAKLKAIEAGDHAVLEFHFMNSDIVKKYTPLGIHRLGTYYDVPVSIESWFFSLSINNVEYYWSAKVDSNFVVKVPVAPGNIVIDYSVSSRCIVCELEQLRLLYSSLKKDEKGNESYHVIMKATVSGNETVRFNLIPVGEPVYGVVPGGVYIFQSRADAQQVKFQMESQKLKE